MKAMIFAAGYGIRLQPLTNTLPKALVPINGKPMLQHIMEKLIASQINDFVVNVHHFPGQIIDFLKSKNNFGANISISDESEQLLDTGGGLKNASGLLEGDEPILLYNVDVLSNINLHKLLQFHEKNKALATLVTRKRETQRYLMFSNDNVLTGWRNLKTKKEKISIPELYKTSRPFAFSGIHIVSPEFIINMPGTGKFSIIETYLEVAKTQKIMGYIDSSKLWIDIGKPGQLAEAEKLIQAYPLSS